MNHRSSTSNWKPWRWVRLDLILTMRNIHINSNLNPLTEFTSSRRSTEFKDILPWNITQMITKAIQISTIVISYAVKLRQQHDHNFQWCESHCRINSSIRRKKQIETSRTVEITAWDPRRKVNNLSKSVSERKIITEFTRSIHSTRIGKPVLMIDVKVSKHISRWVDQDLCWMK